MLHKNCGDQKIIMNRQRVVAHKRRIMALQVLSVLAGAPMTAEAQTPPSSGSIFDANREQLMPAERTLTPPGQRVRIENDVADDVGAPLPPASDIRVRVSSFAVTGNQSMSSVQIQDELREFVGQELDFAGLRKVAAKITAWYRAHGYLVARAYLPAQEVRAGEVVIGIREGVIGKVSAETEGSVRFNQYILARHLEALQPGTVIREQELESVLLRLTDIPGIAVKAVLRASAIAGATDILVRISEMTALTARVGIDNYGNYYTGANRLSVNLSLNDALGLGESFTLNTQNSFEGLRIAGLGYVQPIGSSGLSIGANVAELQYNVGKNLKDAQASGQAKISSFFINSALYRTRKANINASLTADFRHFQDTTAATTVNKSATVWTAALYGDWRDGWNGSNGWSLRYGRGRLEKETPNDAALDRITAKAAGDYTKINLSFSRLQQLGAGYSLLGAVNAQYADKNLDASEKMSLGGPNGVRAYPVGEIAGDEGVLGRVELRKTFGIVGNSIVEGALFADAGRVTINKTPWDASVNRASRYGYGVGVNVYNKDVIFNASMAFSPGTDPTSEARNARRFWVSMSGAPQSFAGLASDLGNKGEDFENADPAFVLYGSLGLVPEYVSRSGATPAAPADQSKLATANGRNMPGFWRVRDNVNYIGAHGGLALYEQWKLLWQLELGLSLNYTNRSAESVPDWTHSQDLRNTGLALAHPAAGTLMYGRWDTPMKESTTSFDPFQALTSASHYNIIGSPGFITSITKNAGPVGTASSSNNDDAAFNRRQDGLLGYWTPKLAGFQLKLAFSGNGMKAAPDVDTGYLYGGSLSYERGGFSAVLAAEQHINYFGIASLGRNARGVGSNTHVTQGTSSSDFSMRYGIAYDFGATKISLIADDLSYSEYGVVNTSTTSTDLSNYRRRAYLLGVTHKIGALELRASFAKALAGECSMISGNNVACSTDGMGATSQAIGFSYSWNKQTKLFAQYVVLRNEALANYNYAVTGVFGASGYSSGVGTTIRAIGGGFNYSF